MRGIVHFQERYDQALSTSSVPLGTEPLAIEQIPFLLAGGGVLLRMCPSSSLSLMRPHFRGISFAVDVALVAFPRSNLCAYMRFFIA